MLKAANNVVVAGVIAGILSACSSTAQSNYDRASLYCSRGDRRACTDLPYLSSRAKTERQSNNTNAALGVGALAIGALAVGAAVASDHKDRKRKDERRRGYNDGYYRGYNDGYYDDW